MRYAIKILSAVLFFWAGTFAVSVFAESEIKVSSPAFSAGGAIPMKYTCEGKNISPPLKWSGVPRESVSVALIAEDPDAPAGTWTHWLLFNLPPTVDNLPENIPGLRQLANGEEQGMNGSGKLGYEGPCPPSGSHRYYFRVYALDAPLVLDSGASKAALLGAMKGRVLAQGELMGRYEKKGGA